MNGIFLAFAIMEAIAGSTQIQTAELKDPYPAIVQEAEPERKYYTVWLRASAYDACYQCCGKTDGITASGFKATANHTIAAPPEYAFGQEMEINGITYVVEDRGGAIKGDKIDIFFDTHEEATAFGVQWVEAKVYV
jgi:3D (Asp-Asp-Asp) domain-containing protein